MVRCKYTKYEQYIISIFMSCTCMKSISRQSNPIVALDMPCINHSLSVYHLHLVLLIIYIDRKESVSETISSSSLVSTNSNGKSSSHLSTIQRTVLDATNDEPSGTSRTIMMQIADATHDISSFQEIFEIIVRRLTEPSPKHHRRIYKALLLLEYLLLNGSERVVAFGQGNLGLLEELSLSFHHVDADGRDQGQNIRIRANEIFKLLTDGQHLVEQRVLARENRDKYIGISSDSLTNRAFNQGNGINGSRGNGEREGGRSNGERQGMRSNDLHGSNGNNNSFHNDHNTSHEQRKERHSQWSERTSLGQTNAHQRRQSHSIATGSSSSLDNRMSKQSVNSLSCPVANLIDLDDFESEQSSVQSNTSIMNSAQRTRTAVHDVPHSRPSVVHSASHSRPLQDISMDDFGDFVSAPKS